MKAIVQNGYGSTEVLSFQEVKRPTPGEDEVLVRVHATSVHPDVWHLMTGLPRVLRLMGAGLLTPKNPIPGTEVAGVVEEIGGKVTRFQRGDEVFGETLRRMQWVNGGAFAEYATAPEKGLALKPANVTFAQAAAVPTAALIALPALEGRLHTGQRLLVNGAGGGVGSLIVQLGKAFGAQVTAVDCTEKLDLLRSLGADEVIDYTCEDFTSGGGRFDLIVDIPGNRTLSECRRALNPTGLYVLIGHDGYGHGMRRWVGLIPRMLKLEILSRFVSHLPRPGASKPDRTESMKLIAELLGAGKLSPPIDRSYPLSEVPEAMTYLQEGKARGKIIVTV